MLMNSITIKKIINFTMIIGILLIPIIAILYVIATIRFGVFSMATQNYGGAMFLDGIGIICLSWINKKEEITMKKTILEPVKTWLMA